MKKTLFALAIICACELAYSSPHYKDQADLKQTVQKDKAQSIEKYGELNGTMALVSNYLFRGISQTENNPALQGGLTYALPIGLYASVWGSNVKFEEESDANLELDNVVGFKGTTLKDELEYDISLQRYNYPGANQMAYNELITLLKYYIFQFTLGYSGNAYNTHQTGIYYNGAIIYDIPAAYLLKIENVSIQAAMGHYSLPRAAGNSYNDYLLSLNKKFNDTYSIALLWTSTNGRQHVSPYDSSMISGQVIANF